MTKKNKTKAKPKGKPATPTPPAKPKPDFVNGRIPTLVMEGIIGDLKDGVPIEEVSEKYKRPVNQIQRILKEKVEQVDRNGDGASNTDVILKFRKRLEWKLFSEQFSEEEMKIFEYEYAKLYRTFNEDELTTPEENQLFMSIQYYILIHRNLKERKKATVELDRLEKILHQTVKNGPNVAPYNGDDQAFRADITQYEYQINMIKSAQTAKTGEHKTLTDKHQSFMEDLKATRNQRIEKFAEKKNKTNFIDVIKELQDEEKRKSVGLDMGLMKMAMEKQKKEWGQTYMFADGEIDRIITDSETVEYEDQYEYEEEGTDGQDEQQAVVGST